MSGKAEGTQASVLPGLSDEKAAERIGVLCAEDMKTSGILASVSAAQFILESGYGRTELAQKANNCFGMKCMLSGNSWGGSAWDGTSKYRKKTQEDDGTGKLYTVTADFRKKPGTDQEKTGKYTGAGCFTIAAEADGVGASKWGLLKAYEKERNGWISLDFVTRI